MHDYTDNLRLKNEFHENNSLKDEIIENVAKEKKGVFLDMLLGTLGATLLGNLLTDKGDMLLGTLGTSLLGNLLTDKGERVKARLEPIRIFNATLYFS